MSESRGAVRPTIACLITLIVIALTSPAGPVAARDIRVSTAAELRAAVNSAVPGDTIHLASGIYDFGSKLALSRAGTEDEPITLRPELSGKPELRFGGDGSVAEGLHVMAPYWVIAGLDIVGACPNDSRCEHAFHVVGAADGTVISGNVMREFNAAIKGNGDGSGPPANFPDDVFIAYNEIFNSRARNTGNPVTPIDVVGGRRWIIRGNFIHDFQKGGGNGISYAAFLKGNSKDGMIEQNLIVCEHLHKGGTRLGLSFGGGGSQPERICEEGTCTPEHEGGIMRNNIIANCPADVGMYLNKAADAKIYNNTLFNTGGIDVRFAASTVDLRYNVHDGRIRERDGGSKRETGNVAASTADLRRWFADPNSLDFELVEGAMFKDKAGVLPEVNDDFCRQDRDDGAPDAGAIEYSIARPCNTDRVPPVPMWISRKTATPTETSAPVTETPTLEPTEVPSPTLTPNAGTPTWRLYLAWSRR